MIDTLVGLVMERGAHGVDIDFENNPIRLINGNSDSQVTPFDLSVFGGIVQKTLDMVVIRRQDKLAMMIYMQMS